MSFHKKLGFLFLGDEFGTLTIWDLNSLLKKIDSFKEEKKANKKIKLGKESVND